MTVHKIQNMRKCPRNINFLVLPLKGHSEFWHGLCHYNLNLVLGTPS